MLLGRYVVFWGVVRYCGVLCGVVRGVVWCYEEF